MKLFRPIVAVVLFVFVPGFIRAQCSIRGFATDSLTASPLVGASIYLVGTAFGASTDVEGHYLIDDIPAGDYEVRASYIGYQPKVFHVTVRERTATELNVPLSPRAVQGKEVVVMAQMKGQLAAINQQLRADKIVNVVSAEKIQELPDANAAEAIGRLPGVSIIRSGGEANQVILRGLSEKFTDITIDGVQIPSTDSTDRTVDLSTISQSSLSGIELYKSLTSDMDGDAIAGTINLVTKRAPSERMVRLDASGDFNALMNSAGQYNLALRYGERFFNDLLGVQLIGNLENRIRSSENYNLAYDQGLSNQTDYAINDFALQFNNENRKRNGFSVLLDYATPDEGVLRLNTVYSGTKRDILTSTRDYPSFSGSTATNGSSVSYSSRDQLQNINTFSSSLVGDNKLAGFSLNWSASYAQSMADFPYDFRADFLENSSLLPSGDSVISGMRVSPMLKSDPQQLISYAVNNFNAATLYDGYYSSQRNYDRQRVAYLNAGRAYSFSNSLSGFVRFGGKYRVQDKSNLQGRTYAPYYLGYWQPYEIAANGTIRKKDLSGTYFNDFYQSFLQSSGNRYPSLSDFLNSPPDSRQIFSLYMLNPIVNRGRLDQWYSLNKNGVDASGKTHEFSVDPTAETYDYSITERVAAGYLMNTLDIGNTLTFIAGLRVERENNNYNSKYSPVQTGGFPIPPDVSRDTTAAHDETIWFPNFNLNYRPTGFLNLRLAAYRALARPDFNYRLNTYFSWRTIQPAGPGQNSNQLLLGNPLLRDAKAWNYEANISFFGDKVGLFTVSAFYKRITDMFHELYGINATGDSLIQYLGLQWKNLFGGGSYALTVPFNSDQPTYVWGFELEHQINFAFLPGFLQNIVLSYNASLVRSETHIIATTIDTSYYYVPGIPVPFPKYTNRIIDQKQQLEEQPEFYGNISLGYDVGGFSGRVSLFHQSQFNVSFSPDGRRDIISNPFTRLDLALRQIITKNLSLILNVDNLTDTRESTSLYDRVNGYKILRTDQRYGITADFGAILQL